MTRDRHTAAKETCATRRERAAARGIVDMLEDSLKYGSAIQSLKVCILQGGWIG